MIQMFRLEARKYAMRWGLAAALLVGLIQLSVSAARWRLAVSDHLLITSTRSYRFPVGVPRLLDALVVAIPVTIIAYLFFRSHAIRRFWAKDMAHKYLADAPLQWGLVIGACGLWPVSAAGFEGMLAPTPLVLCILLAFLAGAHRYQVVLCSVVIILTIWAGETVLVGCVAGTVYAVAVALYTVAWLVAMANAVIILATVYGLGEYTYYAFLLPKKVRPERLLVEVFMAFLRRKFERKNKPSQIDDAAAA